MAMRSVGKEFEVRVAGSVSDDLRDQLAELREILDPMSTAFLCRVEDSAELLGVLARMTSLGLSVVEVRPVPVTPADRDHLRPGSRPARGTGPS
jgi:hypothetical protein